MKKIISSVIAIFLAIILLSNVSAVEVSPDDIPAGSYLIGTHLFDREGSSSYNGTLTVRHIMLASKTITGNSLEDMQILYKRAFDGAWLDSLTNDVVELPEKVNVEYKNLEQMLQVPTLSAPMGGTDYALFSIRFEGAYAESTEEIDGFELYEKDGEELKLIGEYEPTDEPRVTIDVGESKTYVARVYKYNKANQKVYSDYSNEVNFKYELEVPTLSKPMGGIDYARFSIRFEGAYAESTEEIDGFELYEKDGEDLKLIGEYEPTDEPRVTINIGESKTYVARVYKHNKASQKVYSDYSNDVTASNTSTVAYGDINNDRIVDENDAYLLEDYLMEYDTLDEQGMKNADMNGDGVVNDDDYPILIQHLVTGTNLPFYETKENTVKIEYYALDELIANEYLVSVPDGLEIEWNGEYQFGDNSVIYDIALFELPSDFDEFGRFKGWYIDKEGTNKFDETQSITGTTKLYAVFDMDFTVVYNENGATSGTMENSVFTIGESTNLNKNTYTRPGYKFLGWTEDLEEGYVKYEDEGEIEIPLYYMIADKEDYVLYAVWEKVIVYGDVTEDGEIDSRDGTKVLRYIMELEELTEEQFIAADVNLDDELDYVDYQIILKKAAGYIESLPYDSGEKYTISYDVDGGSGELGIELLQTEYAEISLPLVLPNLVKTGYIFVGWTGSNGDTPETEVTITEGTTGNLEYTANWALIGDVTMNGELTLVDIRHIRGYITGKYEMPEDYVIEYADANLDGVVDDVDLLILEKYITDKEEYGIDKLPYESGEKYTITYNLNGGDYGNKTDNIKTYAAISLPYTLQTPTKEGYIFIGWTGSNGDTPETEVTITEGTTGDLEYTANWELAE